MKVYQGRRNAGGLPVVTVGTMKADGTIVDEHPLAPRNDLYNHSPDGFEWGYGGSGPAQLALALCADALFDDRRARAVYQHFKWAHVARWKFHEEWRLTADQILAEIQGFER